MRKWGHRCYIIIPIDKAALANRLAAKLDPDTGGDKTFGDVLLSPTGLPPATHTACSSVLTAACKTKIDQHMTDRDVPLSKLFYRAANWDWQKALNDRGLKVIGQL